MGPWLWQRPYSLICEPQPAAEEAADANDRDCRLLLDVLCQCQKGRDV